MDMKVALQQRRSFDEFYDHVTHTGSQLEEIAGDLYALESMISLARDVEDLRLYQAHCRRLEATIYTLHEKIGSWQHSAAHRRTHLQRNDYNAHAHQLDEVLMLVESYISTVCRFEEEIMRLQQMIHDKKAIFAVAQHVVCTKTKRTTKPKIVEKEIGWV